MDGAEPFWNHKDVHAPQSAGIGGAFTTAFLIAMQESRQSQAAREVHRYRRLAVEAEAYERRRAAELRRGLDRHPTVRRNQADQRVRVLHAAAPMSNGAGSIVSRVRAGLRIVADLLGKSSNQIA
ncbi:MAG: hypothetical protein JO000_16780 [Alphaproteobacteria bacterium]|nr:hypothetical protein [Alphaproteobacteria bacterium]